MIRLLPIVPIIYILCILIDFEWSKRARVVCFMYLNCRYFFGRHLLINNITFLLHFRVFSATINNKYIFCF